MTWEHSFTMPSIAFSGLASGLDTTAIINAMMSVERIPLQRLEAQNADYTAQLGVVNSLSAGLSGLQSAAKDLDTIGEFLSYSGTSDDEDIATISASGDAVPGTYDVEVTLLAEAQRTYSDGMADQHAALSGSDQTLTLSIDGVDTDITVTAGDSLRNVADAINASGADVSAGIMFDGTEYRLQVSGRSTGADNAITFTDTGLGLNLSDPLNTVQSAIDAVFKVDGFDMTSDSNTISDVLEGVTLSLEGTGTTSVTIAPDNSAVEEKIQEFVDQYNSVFAVINQQVGEGKGTATLNGDSTVRALEQSLQSMISSAIPGLTDGSGNALILADLGIETQSDGTLTLDTEDLQDVLNQDFQGAAQYFAGDVTSSTDGIGALVDSLVESYVNTTDGLLEGRKDGINDRISSNEDRMEQLEAYLETFEANLQNQFTQLEQAMSALQSQQQYLAQFLNL